MNKKETLRIEDKLIELGFISIDKSSDILHFATMPYRGKKILRDEHKNLQHFSDRFRCHFLAKVNPNGVGDGKKPTIALTYAIGICNNGECREYRHKHFHECELLKFYSYDRNLKKLMERFSAHLKLNNII